MKKNVCLGISGIVLVFGLLVFGCASSGSSQSTGDVINAALTPGDNETLIVVQRPSAFVGAAVQHFIFVDGEQVLSLPNGSSGRIVVSNGEHTIYSMINTPIKVKPMSERLTFTAGGTELHFTAASAVNKAVLTQN
jgi:hypothetical protein